MVRLKDKYKKEIVPQLKEKFGYKNDLAVPKLEKIVINMGVGDGNANPKALDSSVETLTALSGQHPVKTKAKHSIANFKLRAGMEIGVMVTLRKDRMYEFFDRLVSVALPRVRDFRGTSNSFDGRGNYTLGIKEQIIFPQVNYDKIDRIRGMNICIVTTAKSDEEAKELLSALGMPFRK
ncbi:MAG: 50S ribosomal protein L5 [bacterium]|nr:50S ribosomal protein L5 [bacterium]